MFEILQNYEIKILDFINNNLHSPIMDKVMVMITSIGNVGIVWILVSLGLIITPKYRKVGIMTICALILNTILGDGILKPLIQRPRPFTSLVDMKLLISAPTSYSFPSGHTASAFAAAGIIGAKIKKVRVYVFTLAILIAFSRMYLYVHYPGDVIGGIILGLCSSQIVLYIFKTGKKAYVKK